MFARDDEVERKPAAGSCAKIVAAAFGTMFLVALLAVPVTTSTSRVRQDPGSNMVTRTTYPRKATMFLPQVLSARARRGEDREVHVRTTQWVATMAIIAVLGLFDYGVFCRLLRRPRRPDDEPGPE
jgi:hypothetical protein